MDLPIIDRSEETLDPRLVRDSRGLISAHIPTQPISNHAPTLLELRDGDILCAWFGGSDEGNADIALWVSRLEIATGEWTPAQQVTFDNGRSDQNPGLFQCDDGEIWLIYPSQVARGQGIPETFNLQHTALLRRVRSADGGRTWSEPDTMFDQVGSFVRQPIQRLQSGRLVLPQWLCFDDDTRNGSDISIVQISDDKGETWRRVDIPDSEGLVHASIVETRPGHLLAFFRSRFADRVYLAVSEDDAETWSSPNPTELPNNNSSIGVALLPSGNVAVIHNDIGFNSVHRNVFWPYERPSVTVSISPNEGRSFPWRRVLEPGDGFSGYGNLRANRRHEYPTAMVDSAGRLHAAYAYNSRVCIKHTVLDELWVTGRPQDLPPDCGLWS